MKPILELLLTGAQLSEAQAYEVMRSIGEGKYSTEHITAFISHYWHQPVSTGELSGFRNALLDLAVPIKLDVAKNAIDLCGTGGDGKNTFNISTLTAIVVAGAGYKVVKHGNYGVTSVSGSSNVLEAMGCVFSNEVNTLSDQLETCNMTFLHAPLFHPALKEVGAIRRNLGLKTFFNMLGPMVNPAEPNYQLVGVYNLQVARQYQYLLQQSGRQFTIVHSLDGYDEISLTGDTRVISNDFDGIMGPGQLFASKTYEANEIFGGNSVEEATEIFKNVLKARGTIAQNEVVLANAALAIQTLTGKNLGECHEEARETLLSGKAGKNFNQLVNG